MITVADTGVGIAADALTEVFSMFSQVSKHIGRSQGALGIGLSLVRSLMHMHGGELQATSAGESKGSTFIVRLLLPHEATPSPAMPAQSCRYRISYLRTALRYWWRMTTWMRQR